MYRVALALILFAAAAGIGGWVQKARGRQDQQIRVAVLASRGGEMYGELKQLNDKLREATGNSVSLRIYPNGVAGDESDILRKIADGQMEGAVLTASGLAQIVPEIAVLDIPGLVDSYQQLEAVQAALRPKWEKQLLEKGFVTLAWGEGGRYRLFSKKPAAGPSEVKGSRPWLWPENGPLKALWQTVGAEPVSSGAPGLLRELQTGTVDAMIATALTVEAMGWDSKLGHVSEQTLGVLTGAFVIKKKSWKALPEEARQVIEKSVAESALIDRKKARAADELALKKLLKESYALTTSTPESRREWKAVFDRVREQFTVPAALSAAIAH